MIFEIDFLTKQIKELLKGRGNLPIAEELLLGELTGSLMENTKLEPGAGYQGTGAGTHDRHQRVHI